MHTATTSVAAPAASISPFHPLPHPSRPPATHVADAGVTAARDQLGALVAEAGALDLTDQPAWDRLGAAAGAAIGTLVAAGALPSALLLDPRAAAPVVARTVATAWRWSEVA